ncbi:MAG TPA: DUF4870 domain-containing protein, partial [Chloroflexi bacterium]|nr:DUF4870 domain-containing protein [Chloroflexota bacterium]
MTTETPNTPNVPPQVPPQPLRPEDERTWAALAHASVLLDLVTGFGGLIGALVIWLMYKE